MSILPAIGLIEDFSSRFLSNKNIIYSYNKTGGLEIKSLVVYYSNTGKTKRVAEKIAKEFDAEIEEIIDTKKRKGLIALPKNILTSVCKKGTVIEKTQKSPQDYDLIILGTPLWMFGPAPAIRTYMKTNDLTGKYVAFFCTYDFFGAGGMYTTFVRMAPQATWVGKILFSKSAIRKIWKAEKRIVRWSETIKSFAV